jgi:two-component system CAI-1 autoinducer sensor kinase/phosphatase CqsS
VIDAFTGSIECYSTENISTTFIIRLPIITSPTIDKIKYDSMSTKKILFIGNQPQILTDLNHLAYFYNFTLCYEQIYSDNIISIDEKNYDCIIIDINLINNSLLKKLQDQIDTTSINIILISHKDYDTKIIPTETYKPYFFEYDHIDTLQKKLTTQCFTRTKQNNTLSSPINVNKTKIMIVDDNVSLRLYCGILLKNAGYDVIEADNGLTALNYLQEITVDLILMDSQMPIMSGIEATKEIRTNIQYNLHQCIPIICYSGLLDEQHKEHLITVGISDFLVKPSSKAALLSIVNKWLKS